MQATTIALWFLQEVGKVAVQYCKDHPDIIMHECEFILCKLKKWFIEWR